MSENSVKSDRDSDFFVFEFDLKCEHKEQAPIIVSLVAVVKEHETDRLVINVRCCGFGAVSDTHKLTLLVPF